MNCALNLNYHPSSRESNSWGLEGGRIAASSANFARGKLQRHCSTGRLSKNTSRISVARAFSSSLVGLTLGLADLGLSSGKSSNDQTVVCPAFSKQSQPVEESEHTAATEDLSSSSTHSTSCECVYREVEPSPLTRVPSLTKLVEKFRQKHLLKLKIVETIQALDKILDKCHAIKSTLVTMKMEDEESHHISLSSGDEISLSVDEFSVSDYDEDDDDEDDDDDFDEEDSEDEHDELGATDRSGED